MHYRISSGKYPDNTERRDRIAWRPIIIIKKQFFPILNYGQMIPEKMKTAIWPHIYQKGAPNVYRGYKYPVP